MRRGDLYLVKKSSASSGRLSTDPKTQRVFVVVSRDALIKSQFSTVICAPVYSSRHGISTQVPIGPGEGVKHDSSIHCDELVSLPKQSLTNYLGSLSALKLRELHRALSVALDLDNH